MTVKIADNTLISAAINEIKSIDILEVCCGIYRFFATSEVYKETAEGFDTKKVEKVFKNIEIDNTVNQELVSFLGNRYPYLHQGELSSFVLAIYKHNSEDEKCYYVTDDRKMRETIENILEDDHIRNQIGMNMDDFNYTGTVGLIRRLGKKRVLSKGDLNKIAEDLRYSSFRVTDTILESIEEIYNENICENS
jgi:predicted nucleic acid-binding protein